MGKSILVVDDNPTVRRLIREQLEASGLSVCGEAEDGVDAIEKVQTLTPDLIILDVAMPRMNGLDAAREISKIRPDAPIILNTLHAEAIRSGPETASRRLRDRIQDRKSGGSGDDVTAREIRREKQDVRSDFLISPQRVPRVYASY